MPLYADVSHLCVFSLPNYYYVRMNSISPLTSTDTFILPSLGSDLSIVSYRNVSETLQFALIPLDSIACLNITFDNLSSSLSALYVLS